ncbi:MAG TPA: tetratricopeptide repeat protein [Candidatus Deferrimicrobium sp.]|nr:tetratricopeptide repeat protein [Candidatus Deferrimicrobium sp.]
MKRQMYRWPALTAAIALLSLTSPHDALSQRTRIDKETLEVQELVDLLAEFPDDAQVHFQLGILLAQQDRRDEALSHFEQAIRLEPQSLIYGNEYRMTSIWFKECDRAIEFFEELVDRNESPQVSRLQLALAYVDKMPSVMLGIVSQGLLSNKSINRLTQVIEQDSSNWAAWYARAMNHLHWPRAMRHGTQSIHDFQQALKIQSAMNLPKPRPYFVLTYIGLGDALVKEKRHDEARDVWRRGLELFSKNAHLRKRLTLADNVQLEKFVEKARWLEKQIDTDLSILWAD